MTCRPIDLHDKNEGVKNFDTFGQLSTGTQGWNARPLRRQGQHGRLLQGVRAGDWYGSKGIVRCVQKLSLTWQRRWPLKAQPVARQAASALE